MILSSLVNLYERLAANGNIYEEGWSEAKISCALDLDLSGNLIGVADLRREIQKGKKTVLVPSERKLPAPVKRAAGIEPNFLWDNSSYVLGIDEKGKPERTKECFTAFVQKFKEITERLKSEDGTVRAIHIFLENWISEEAAEHPMIKERWEEILSGNLVFRVNGKFADENPNIIQAWNEYLMQNKKGEKIFCLATGRRDNIARLHPSVKGVYGAQSSGASLVSFNAPSYCSYGKEQGANSPVGEFAAFAYTSALNYLLSDSNHRESLGDMTIVYWTASAKMAYLDLFSAYFGSDKAMDQVQLNAVVHKIAGGQTVSWEDTVINPEDEFFILGLSPNAARLSVRFFLRTTFGQAVKNLNDHYENIRIVHGEKKKDRLSLYNLLSETVNQNSKDKKPSPQLAGALARAVLEGMPYPDSLYTGIQLRIRAERNVNYGKASVIKAYLLRNAAEIDKEVLTVSLNENSNYEPYVLGRLFSVLEGLQSAANPGINATIRDKYFNSACATPSVVFPILLKLSQNHLKKLSAKLKVYYEKQIQELTGKLGTEFPNRLNLKQQGTFQLGYYHQTEKRFEKRNNMEEIEKEDAKNE